MYMEFINGQKKLMVKYWLYMKGVMTPSVNKDFFWCPGNVVHLTLGGDCTGRCRRKYSLRSIFKMSRLYSMYIIPQ